MINVMISGQMRMKEYFSSFELREKKKISSH